MKIKNKYSLFYTCLTDELASSASSKAGLAGCHYVVLREMPTCAEIYYDNNINKNYTTGSNYRSYTCNDLYYHIST